MSRSVLSPVAVEYPSGDGKPMAENDWQLHAILDAVSTLYRYFENRPDVYVSGDLLIYYEEGNPQARVAPDVFVVFGVPKHRRMTYKLWEEGPVPAFAMEVASAGTWREDEGRKAALYERLEIREYWQYDPTGDYLGLHLKGRRLVDGAYEPQPVVESLDGTLILRSETLGIEMRVNGEDMRFRDPATGRDLPRLFEEHAARRAAEGEAEREAAVRRAAEGEAEREAAVRRAAEGEAEREAAARRAAEGEAGRELAARRAAEARIAELEALLEEKHGSR